MRPELIEVEGFSAFKAHTLVDFDNVDLFGFTGPTGSGKSSLIDAMVFALYGSVPRYDDNRLVAPVISQGRNEAKVRLRFSVDGQTFDAVRVVRRRDGGATTKEARLERGDVTVAGDKREMDDAVEKLLGLNLDQFKTCVVLPQGQFAALLHARPSDRQDLLVRLLDLGLYERLASGARKKERDARSRIDLLESQLTELADATAEAETAATTRLEAMSALAERVEKLVPERDALAARLDEVRLALAELDGKLEVLGSVDAPLEASDLANRLEQANRERMVAQEEAARASASVIAAESERDELDDPAALEGQRQSLVRRAELVASIEKGVTMVAEAADAVEPAATRSADAEAAVIEATQRLEELRRAHALADAAAHLHVGDDCPLCGGTVEQLPEVDREALDRAEAECAARKAAASAASDELNKKSAELGRFETRLDDRRAELASLDLTLTDVPQVAEIDQRLAAVAEADRALRERRSAERSSRQRLDEAEAALRKLQAVEAEARRDLAQARDRASRASVGDDPPPTPAGTDLAVDWADLVEWCAGQRERADDERTSLQADAAGLTEQLETLGRDIGQAFVDVGEDSVVPDKARQLATDLYASARADRARLAERVGQRARVETELDELGEVEAVHGLLGNLLGAKGFEQWLLDEALEALVDGASQWLVELSSGAYALSLDDKRTEFLVVDLHDADQLRLAKTLSGGETFLASLALALALAERISELASDGAPRLESIFLDEGFGTLDPQTLDVVASAIEELGATGRMVGVVSHVRELAERLPTVFEVSKGADTSTVERIDR